VRRELSVIYAVAALALIVVSIGALFASRSVARTQALQEAERITTRLADLQLGPLLAVALDGDPQRRAELDRATTLRMGDGYLTEITVWAADGTVVYADDTDEIGRKFAPPPEVTAAIKDGVISSAYEDQPEVSALKTNPDGPGFVEVYVPFKPPEGPTLAFEAYYDWTRVDAVANSLFWYLIPLVLVPLLVLQLIQVPIAGSLAGRVRRHEAERSDLLERSLMASDRERIRIAGDLHDGPVQDLAGISYALDAVAPSVAEPHRVLMLNVQNTVRQALGSLRRLMVDLYPPDLNAGQLPRTIAELAVPLQNLGVEVSLDLQPMPDMDTDTVTTLYRVARESLANVAAHAQADRVEISLHVVDGDSPRDRAGGSANRNRRVCLIIVDDGIGLDPERMDRRDEGHLGLRLLKDRVENLSGTWQVTAQPGRGTRVLAALPLEPGT
jgi:two-component system NarL family sensor kinase